MQFVFLYFTVWTFYCAVLPPHMIQSACLKDTPHFKELDMYRSVKYLMTLSNFSLSVYVHVTVGAHRINYVN